MGRQGADQKNGVARIMQIVRQGLPEIAGGFDGEADIFVRVGRNDAVEFFP